MLTKNQIKRELSFYHNYVDTMCINKKDAERIKLMYLIFANCERILKKRCTKDKLLVVLRAMTRIQRIIRACGHNIDIYDYELELFVSR